MAKTVLVIEDERAIGEMLAMLLGDEGYTVRVARNSTEALAAAQAHAPDLITLDLGLPGVDGRLLLRTLRQNGGAPVVVISAYPEQLAPDDRALAAAVISKPFDIDDMLASVAGLLP
jgi:DNA-binding response OmpR family regulator